MAPQEKLKLNQENNLNPNFINSSLRMLNMQSDKNSYSVDNIDWELIPDQKKFWAPEALISISHLPVYQTMSQDLKIAFNQYNAMGVAELFMFFEEYALAPIMEKALRSAKSQELKIALQHFIDEEYKHSLCFKKLLLKASPALYSEDNFKFHFIRMNWISKSMFNVLKLFPSVLPAWVWVAIFFEERTLMFSKEYIRYKKQDATKIDELFYQVHFYHMIDEVRHVKLDEHMIENFYKPMGSIHANLVEWIVRRFISRSAYPINMICACLDQIKKTTPDLLTAQMESQIIEEAKQLTSTESFIAQNFSDSSAPRTRILMARFPEFKNFWQKIMVPKR